MGSLTTLYYKIKLKEMIYSKVAPWRGRCEFNYILQNSLRVFLLPVEIFIPCYDGSGSCSFSFDRAADCISTFCIFCILLLCCCFILKPFTFSQSISFFPCPFSKASWGDGRHDGWPFGYLVLLPCYLPTRVDFANASSRHYQYQCAEIQKVLSRWHELR